MTCWAQGKYAGMAARDDVLLFSILLPIGKTCLTSSWLVIMLNIKEMHSTRDLPRVLSSFPVSCKETWRSPDKVPPSQLQNHSPALGVNGQASEMWPRDSSVRVH